MSCLFMHSLLSSICAFSFSPPPLMTHSDATRQPLAKKSWNPLFIFASKRSHSRGYSHRRVVSISSPYNVLLKQPLTIQYGLNEEPIKCILWYSSRLPKQLIGYVFFGNLLYCRRDLVCVRGLICAGILTFSLSRWALSVQYFTRTNFATKDLSLRVIAESAAVLDRSVSGSFVSKFLGVINIFMGNYKLVLSGQS